jgi:hypothetical protein
MRSSCYEPDVVITNLISNAYETLPLVQTPICPIFLQNKICSDYEEEVYIEKFNEEIITIGMCGNLAERKNFRIFLKVAEHLPQYNFMWIGGDKLDTNLPNVFHISNTTNPFKYYKCIDYFVLFSECEPFGNVVIENLLLNKKILAFKDNVWFDFKHELTKENYFEYDGNITTENAIKHILTNATQKQELKEYKDTPSNLYVKSNFSHYTSDFLKLLKQKKNYRNNIKQITNKQDVFVKCKSGFCNQLRLMLAGSFLVTNGFINSYTQEWLLSNENNVDYLGYFNSLPGVTLAPITEGKSVSFNNVIHTTGFSAMINFYTSKSVSAAEAISEVSSKLIPKDTAWNLISGYDVSEALGVHLRRTDKTKDLCKEILSEHERQIMEESFKYKKVYLATDNFKSQQKYKKLLGEKLIMYSNITEYRIFNSIRYTQSEHTIADFMILQKCQKFIGTDKSSFSTLIKYMRKSSFDAEFGLNL